MSSILTSGGVFPDYELPDQDGVLQRLSVLQGIDPMVVVLSRGEYCPKDQVQMRGLVEFQKSLDVGYASLVTIATDSPQTLQAWRDEIGATWPFLSDSDRRVQRDLDIVEYTDPRHNAMIPHTLVLAPGLRIHRVYMGYWFWGRPTNDELHHDLREVVRTCRPDWDIASAELRADWDGERRLHYGYRSRVSS